MEAHVMGQSQATQEKESESIARIDVNGSSPIERTELADDRGPIPSFPPLALDPETGRMLLITDEELAARREASIRMLAVLEHITDENDTDEKWREVYRNIDAGRPHRPLFEGLY
jgi:hypothetical protein